MLALFASQYGIQIHAYVVMSDHYHLVVTDTRGRMPDFQRDLNSLLARSIGGALWVGARIRSSRLIATEVQMSRMSERLRAMNLVLRGRTRGWPAVRRGGRGDVDRGYYVG